MRAEFLIHESVPFSLIEKIGVHNEVILQQISLPDTFPVLRHID